MARICCVCDWRPVELVTGFKCNNCLWYIDQRYRLRRRLALIKPATRYAVFARDGERCRYCGSQVHFRLKHNERTCELDHVIPARVGGSGHLDNVVVSCLDCNRIKQGREYIRTRALIWYIDNETEWDVAAVYRARGLCA